HSRCLFVSQLSRTNRDPHSFPTRRSSDLRKRAAAALDFARATRADVHAVGRLAVFEFECAREGAGQHVEEDEVRPLGHEADGEIDRKSTRLNSSHVKISYAVFCLKKKTEC